MTEKDNLGPDRSNLVESLQYLGLFYTIPHDVILLTLRSIERETLDNLMGEGDIFSLSLTSAPSMTSSELLLRIGE